MFLELGFNNDELTSGPKKSIHFMQSKQNGALEFTARSRYSLCSHREGKAIAV